jgi:SAM-dependent methyltransferase
VKPAPSKPAPPTTATPPTPPTPAGFYDDARVYDILHRPGTAAEVTGLERIAARFVRNASNHWLEPACGTARCLRVAAGRGKRVSGFDLEPGMIAYAEQRLKAQGLASRAHLFTADMTDFAGRMKRPAGFAFNTINTIRHLDSDDAMLAHLGQVAAALTRGGVYAVGLSTCAYWLEQETEDVWIASRSGTWVTQTVQYLPPTAADRTERVVSHLAIDERGKPRGLDSSYTLRAYSRDEWLGLIGRSAMRLVATVDEDAGDLEPPVLGYAIYVLGV